MRAEPLNVKPSVTFEEVDVWYRDTQWVDQNSVLNALNSLSAGERTSAERFHFAHDRRDFILAHDLLRRSLSRYKNLRPSEWEFEVNACGKPFIRNVCPNDASLSFSLSHTRGLVACAITASLPVGIDVERGNRVLDVNEIAERYFSCDEAAAVRNCDARKRDLHFLELWTLKEAFLKASGTGLSQGLRSASFQLMGDRIVFALPAGMDEKEWHFALFEPEPNARLAVTMCGAARPRFLMRQIGDADRPAACAPSGEVSRDMGRDIEIKPICQTVLVDDR